MVLKDSVEYKGTSHKDTESGEKNIDENFKVGSWGYRHQQSFILFCTLTIAYSMRACMGVALVAMTHHSHAIGNVTANGSTAWNVTANGSLTGSDFLDVDVEDFHVHGFFNALMLCPPYPTFKWEKKVQDMILSSFFFGYMLLQIPAGQLAHRFGARYLLCGAMLVNSAISILLPLAAYYGGWVCIVLMRLMQGLSQACIFPSMHTVFGKWAPLEERGRLTAMTYGGQALGAVLGLPITGFISASSTLGWPGIFRFYGLLSGVTGAVLWWLAADEPANHPRISAAEKKYIEDGLGVKKGYETRKIPVPWGKILRCRGLYAIIVAHIGQTWGQLILYSEVPAYMDKIMGVNIKANGLLTALPFFVMWLTNFLFSWLTDMMIVKKYLSVTNTRKVANSIGCVPAAVGMVALAFAPKNIYVVESILVITCAFKISAHLGFQVNHIDLAPNFAGTMMSLSNFMSNLVASMAPLVCGFILTDVSNEYLWRQVFLVAAGFYFFSNLFYVIVGTAEKVLWNDPDFNTKGGGEDSGLPMLAPEDDRPKADESKTLKHA